MGNIKGINKMHEKDIQNSPIKELNLSKIIQNILLRNGINSISDLRQRHWYEIRNFKNIGKKRCAEIEKAVVKLGLSLKQVVPEYDEKEMKENPFSGTDGFPNSFYDHFYDYDSFPDGPIKEEARILNRNYHHRIGFITFSVSESYFFKKALK